MSRLVIDVSGEQHQQIKTLAALHGKTIKEFILEKIFPTTDDEAEAWNELKDILLSRIEETQKSGVSTKSFDELTKEIIQARK
jgi:hypothetical protein